MKQKVLVIVAHPDDETIWVGGTVLNNLGKWDLTVISLCRKDDKDRAPKFRKVCEMLKAKGHISDLEDEKVGDIQMSEATERIKKFAENEYDLIFTHGKNGEYGHKRHIDVHNAVVEMLKRKMLSCKRVFFFSYQKKGKYCDADRESDKFIKLNELLLEKKRELIHNIYGFEKSSFEYNCCKDVEAFKSM